MVTTATNRLVPNGLGGTAVNLRYLARAGVTPGAAGTAVAMLAVLVALGVIVGGLIAEHWVVATLRRMAASTRPAVSPPAEPAPEAPSARDAA